MRPVAFLPIISLCTLIISSPLNAVRLYRVCSSDVQDLMNAIRVFGEAICSDLF